MDNSGSKSAEEVNLAQRLTAQRAAVLAARVEREQGSAAPGLAFPSLSTVFYLLPFRRFPRLRPYQLIGRNRYPIHDSRLPSGTNNWFPGGRQLRGCRGRDFPQNSGSRDFGARSGATQFSATLNREWLRPTHGKGLSSAAATVRTAPRNFPVFLAQPPLQQNPVQTERRVSSWLFPE